ncbi:MAG: alpha/beta hydrolase [Sphingomicrobium sp.]
MNQIATTKTVYRDGYHTVADQIRLHYREYGTRGDGPPLLCLHALTRNARDFHDFALRMAPRHHVIVPEFRGRGFSGRDPEPMRYTPLTYTHDVIALLDHLGIADAIIIGTSLGGLVAMVLAAIDDDRIAAAVLNDVGPELAEAGLERIKTYVGKTPVFASWAEAAAAAKANHRDFPKAWKAADWERMARRLNSEAADGSVRPDYDMAIAVPFTAPPARVIDMWPMFDALAKHPVLVLRGGESDILTPAVLDRMAGRSDQVTTVTIPGVAHAPDLSEPEALAAIDAFLTRLAG